MYRFWLYGFGCTDFVYTDLDVRIWVIRIWMYGFWLYGFECADLPVPHLEAPNFALICFLCVLIGYHFLLVSGNQNGST